MESGQIFAISHDLYKKRLGNIMAPFLYDGMQNILSKAKDIDKTGKEEAIVKIYRDLLNGVKEWNGVKLTDVVNKIKNESQSADYFDVLVKQVLEGYLIIGSNSKRIPPGKCREFFNNYSTERFVHRCFINIARLAFCHPRLFYNKAGCSLADFEYQKFSFMKDVKKMVLETMENELPLAELIAEYSQFEEEMDVILKSTDSDYRSQTESARTRDTISVSKKFRELTNKNLSKNNTRKSELHRPTPTPASAKLFAQSNTPKESNSSRIEINFPLQHPYMNMEDTVGNSVHTITNIAEKYN